jgi:hypothetical protein
MSFVIVIVSQYHPLLAELEGEVVFVFSELVFAPTGEAALT